MGAATQIWKFEIPKVGGLVEVRAPSLGWAEYFGIQGGRFYVWCPVRPGEPDQASSFQLIGTGWDAPEDYSYVGTVQDGGYVWHLFQSLPREMSPSPAAPLSREGGTRV